MMLGALIMQVQGDTGMSHHAFKATQDAFKRWEAEQNPLPRSDVPHVSPHSCVRTNGTLWLFGNSVTRVHFFAALALLNGGRLKGIEEQKVLCGRGGESHGRRPGQGVSCLGPCSCSVQLSHGGFLTFVWHQRMHHPEDELVRALTRDDHEDSAPSSRNDTSLRTLRIRAGDAVLINVGLDDIVQLSKKSFGKKRTTVKGNLSYFSALWRHGSLGIGAPRLAAAMAAARQRGRAVFWRSSTPICHPNSFITGWGLVSGPAPGGNLSVNGLLAESDETVAVAMKRQRVPVIPIDEIDHVSASACTSRTATSSSQSSLCQCASYLSDHTRIHPDPGQAREQVVGLFRAMQASCKKVQSNTT